MKLIGVALAAMIISTSPSLARPKHHRHHVAHHQVTPQQPSGGLFSFFRSVAPVATSDNRPRDCYGIAWCGCWLRHQFGITDTRYNLAAHWSNFGHRISGPVVGAIARLNHHVGLVVGVASNGNPIIKSGNHRHAVGTAEYPASRVIEYRMPG